MVLPISDYSRFNQASKLFFDSTHRLPGVKATDFQGPNGKETRNAPYGVIVIQASNIRVSVEREYETLIDAFGNIGGAAEAITFIVAILLIFHTDIRYEQRILNDGLLREKRERDLRRDAKAKREDPYTKTVTITEYDQFGMPKKLKKNTK